MSQNEKDPFAHLSAQIDPYEAALYSVYKNAQNFNTWIAQSGAAVTIEAIAETATKFDELLPYNEEEVVVSGTFYKGKANEDGSISLSDSHDTETSAPMICHGFYPYHPNNVVQLGYLFSYQDDEVEPDPDDPIASRIMAWAPLDQCIVEPQETAAKYMERYMLTAKIAIDTVVNDVYDANSAVTALSSVAIKHDEGCALDIDNQRYIMSAYLDAQIPRNQQEPHPMSWKGLYFKANGLDDIDLQQGTYDEQVQERIAFPQRFSFMPELISEDGELTCTNKRSVPTLLTKIMKPIIKGEPLDIKDLPLIAIPITANLSISRRAA